MASGSHDPMELLLRAGGLAGRGRGTESFVVGRSQGCYGLGLASVEKPSCSSPKRLFPVGRALISWIVLQCNLASFSRAVCL